MYATYYCVVLVNNNSPYFHSYVSRCMLTSVLLVQIILLILFLNWLFTISLYASNFIYNFCKCVWWNVIFAADISELYFGNHKRRSMAFPLRVGTDEWFGDIPSLNPSRYRTIVASRSASFD